MRFVPGDLLPSQFVEASRNETSSARVIMIDFGRLRTDLLALGLLAATLFIGLSLVSFNPTDPPAQQIFPAHNEVTNLAGPTGAAIAHDLFLFSGLGTWLLLGSMIVVDFRLFSRAERHDFTIKMIGMGLTLVAFCSLCHLLIPAEWSSSIHGSGGWLGATGVAVLKSQLLLPGTLIFLASGLASGLMLTGEWPLIFRGVKILMLPLTIWSAFGRKPKSLEETTDFTISPPPLPRVSPPAAETAIEGPLLINANEDSVADSWSTHVPIVVKGPPPLPVETPAAWMRGTSPNSPIPQNEEDEFELPSLIPPATAVHPEQTHTSNQHPAASLPTTTNSPGTSKIAAAIAEKIASRSSKVRVNPPVEVASSNLPTGVPVSGPLDALLSLPCQPNLLPELSLLEDGEAFPYDKLAAKAQQNAIALEKAFKQFGLNVKVVEIDTGPVITQFELELEAGLRLSKVTALAEDLAIALRVPSVRVVAPIPGKNTVGVEVPNDIRVMVRLKELIQACPKDFDDKRIPLYFGKDVSGKPLVVDMTKMPHLLIAGRTGTGKSVCLNTLILSILMTRSPDQVKMLMIDPKMVELSPYTKIPHLMHPVITDMKKAEAVLGWAVDKMEERYDLLARVGVRHLDSYNKLGKAAVLKRLGIDADSEEAALVPESMPYIVIIADEMADMIMTSGKDVEGHIIRLAQKSRAVGIHLVLATQKPTVDVITGLIKSNLPARISFQVASRVDSRVVLDEMGAEKLLGNGDMLFLTPGTSNLVRAQGTYVSDEEVNKLIDFFGDREPQYDQELIQLKAASKDGKGKEPGGNPDRDKDELYEQACEVVIREGRGSVSLLQRNLGVGYGRGARMIDWMAEDGIVGTYNGSQAREVLITLAEWEDMHAQV